MAPRAAFSVPNTLTGEGNIAIDLTFESMDDFSPAAIAAKVVSLRPLLEARTQLSNLMAYMDGKAGAEALIEKILADPALWSAVSAVADGSGDQSAALDSLHRMMPSLIATPGTLSPHWPQTLRKRPQRLMPRLTRWIVWRRWNCPMPQMTIGTLQSEVARLPAGGSVQVPVSDADAEDAILRGTGPTEIFDVYAQVVLIADRRNVNRGLVVAGSRHLVEKLGHPREVLSDDCEPLTNKALAAKLVLEDVGPIRVNMLAPAVESLHRVFEAVKRADPDLYARINSSGSLCVRRIRGTTRSLSTHSFRDVVFRTARTSSNSS